MKLPDSALNIYVKSAYTFQNSTILLVALHRQRGAEIKKKPV